jgi:hypothetical protein
MFGGKSKRPLRGKGSVVRNRSGVHVKSIHARDSTKLGADVPSAKNLIRGREYRVPAALGYQDSDDPFPGATGSTNPAPRGARVTKREKAARRSSGAGRLLSQDVVLQEVNLVPRRFLKESARRAKMAATNPLLSRTRCLRAS